VALAAAVLNQVEQLRRMARLLASAPGDVGGAREDEVEMVGSVALVRPGDPQPGWLDALTPGAVEAGVSRLAARLIDEVLAAGPGSALDAEQLWSTALEDAAGSAWPTAGDGHPQSDLVVACRLSARIRDDAMRFLRETPVAAPPERLSAAEPTSWLLAGADAPEAALLFAPEIGANALAVSLPGDPGLTLLRLHSRASTGLPGRLS
jgi:hypothetical protein